MGGKVVEDPGVQKWSGRELAPGTDRSGGDSS